MTTDFAPFFLISVLILAILAVLCLIRAILGPRLADRIMAVNMVGTITIAGIALLSVLINEPDILDIAMIYAGISFVSVIVLTKIYIGIHREKKQRLAQQRTADAQKKEAAP